MREINVVATLTPGFLCGCCCCAETYEAVARVQFGQFDDSKGGAVETRRARTFVAQVQELFGVGGSEPEPMGLMAWSQELDGRPQSIPYVDILSMKESDDIRDVEHPSAKACMAELEPIVAKLGALVAGSRGDVWSAEGAEGLEQPPGARNADFAGLDTVQEHSCTIPASLELSPGEAILGSTSERYELECYERAIVGFGAFALFLSLILFIVASESDDAGGPAGGGVIFLGLGLACCPYYWFLSPSLSQNQNLTFFENRFYIIRPKLMYKTGILLTTKRVVVSAVVRDDSCFSIFLPESMNCCCPTTKGVLTRSLFPADVRAGYVKRSRAWLQGAILTDCGVIELNFYQCDARAEEGGETAITGDVLLLRVSSPWVLPRASPARSLAHQNA